MPYGPFKATLILRITAVDDTINDFHGTEVVLRFCNYVRVVNLNPDTSPQQISLLQYGRTAYIKNRSNEKLS